MKPKDAKKVSLIYEATLRIVREAGLSGITMGNIAKQAGLATGTVYIYFKNKVDLINSLYTECRKLSAGVYFKGYQDNESFQTGFRKIFFNILKHRMEHFNEAVFLQQCYHSTFISDASKEASRKFMEPLYHLVERGKKEQLIKEMDTKLLLIFMVSCINELVKHYHYSRRKPKPQLREQMFLLCWDGMKNNK